MRTIVVSHRFCGPPDSANGGYICGLVAGSTSWPLATVRLLVPPPLDTPFSVHEPSDDLLEVRHGDQSVAQARPGEIELDVPAPPTYDEAVDAATRYAGYEKSVFPTCFVCGVQRAHGDGLRIFAGPVAQREIFAAPWIPDQSLDAGDGRVRPEFMWAALDCPGYAAAVGHARVLLLAEFTADVKQRARIGERCISVGWLIQVNGRKHDTGTALFGADGTLYGRARALWIEPRRA